MSNKKNQITPDELEALSAKILGAGRLIEYTVDPAEKNEFHVELEQVVTDTATGLKKSNPFVQKFNPVAWAQFQKFNKGFNYVRVLWDPTGQTEDCIGELPETKKRTTKKAADK
jgi:hypothetical protein